MRGRKFAFPQKTQIACPDGERAENFRNMANFLHGRARRTSVTRKREAFGETFFDTLRIMSATAAAAAPTYTFRNKIVSRKKDHKPSEVELDVCKAIFELEGTVQEEEVRAELRSVYIAAAREYNLGESRKVLVLYVPYRLLKNFRRVQGRLTRELEKKFSKPVVIVAQRTVLPKPKKNNFVHLQKRPHSRTLAAVQDAILEDVVYPTEIVGRRVRTRLDGSKLFKVYLDQKDKSYVEHRLDTYSGVLRQLTGRNVTFEWQA